MPASSQGSGFDNLSVYRKARWKRECFHLHSFVSLRVKKKKMHKLDTVARKIECVHIKRLSVAVCWRDNRRTKEDENRKQAYPYIVTCRLKVAREWKLFDEYKQPESEIYSTLHRWKYYSLQNWMSQNKGPNISLCETTYITRTTRCQSDCLHEHH